MTSRLLGRFSDPRSLDLDSRFLPVMAPTHAATLKRASTNAHRRPGSRPAPNDGLQSAHAPKGHLRSRSLGRRREEDLSEVHSESASCSEFQHDEDDLIEVYEELQEPLPRHRKHRPMRTVGRAESPSERRKDRSRARPYTEEIPTQRELYAAAYDESFAAHMTPKSPGRSLPSRTTRGRQVRDVIEESRPPISSKRPLVHARHRSAEDIQADATPRLRRSDTIKSNRSKAASVSGGAASFIGGMLGVPLSRQGSTKEMKAPRKRVECVICLSDVSRSKASTLRCRHSMCRSCLGRIFKLSITDPQHMPPRCCTQDHIPLKHVEGLFDRSFKKMWNRKFAEYTTKKRVYCPSGKCGEWIQPANIRREAGRKVGRCGQCKTKVCCACNGRWHGLGPCPIDPETAGILAQAKTEGWTRCYRCKTLVELKEGCNHMTCRCGAEFCMICGVKWKNCDCPWFNEDDRRELFMDDMDVFFDQARSGLGDIFKQDGSPGHTQALRGVGRPMVIPHRRRPTTYQEEMQLRRLQESSDADIARRLQLVDDYSDKPDYELMGDVGAVHGIGNAAEHHMNEDYSRADMDRYRPAPASLPDKAIRARVPSVRQERRSDVYREHRLERSSARDRSGMSSPPAAGPIYPVGMMRSPPPLPPVPSAPSRMLRHRGTEGELYNASPLTPRAERVVGARLSRAYEDEADVHRPPRSLRRRTQQRPTSSDLAGLSGSGTGLNRVSQWRSFVEPGIPDEADAGEQGHSVDTWRTRCTPSFSQ